MPCPHNEITIVQRSQRQSAVAAAAYQSGEKLFCEYDQQVKHYSEKRGIVHNEILLPANAPRSYADRNTLWNAAEAVEKQWNSQLARRWVLTIPREIPPDQYAVLVREFCEQQFVSKGMIVDFAIHDPHPPGHNPHAQDELINELNGVIFLDPVRGEWQTADEYLSGNVRQKLREAEQAAQDSPGYLPNVEALRQAQPRDLDASEIEVRLGATWIDPSYIREFMWETFETPFYQQRMIDVSYSAFTAEWNIRNKNAVSYSNIAAYMTYGTERANAYKILEDTLNLRDVRIYDTKHDADGRERRVLNSKETTLAQQKQQAIRDAFRDWIWRDPDRRHTLVARYNELFNSTRPREYDGSHITFAGMNPEIRLREHQLNAVAHVLYGGNTLLAHEVGAGKTSVRE